MCTTGILMVSHRKETGWERRRIGTCQVKWERKQESTELTDLSPKKKKTVSVTFISATSEHHFFHN